MAGKAVNPLLTGLTIEISNNMRKAVARGAQGSGKAFAAFVRASEIGDGSDIADKHQKIAHQMKTAVLKEYDATVEARKKQSYVTATRLSGRMRSALNNDIHYESDAGGIHFINGPAMSKEAAHWKRLNFGAAPRQNEAAGSRRVPLRLFGRSLFNIGFRIGPQPAFMLPAGFFRGTAPGVPSAEFRGAQTGNPFFVNSKSPYQPELASGIEGRHFLEAGIDVMAKEMGPAYEDLLRKWVQGGGPKKKVIKQTVGKGSPYLA